MTHTFHCVPCPYSCPSKWLLHSTELLAHILVRQSDSYISLSCLPIFLSVKVTLTFHWVACPYSGPSQWHILVRQSNSDILLHFLHIFWSVKVAHTDPSKWLLHFTAFLAHILVRQSDSYISLHSLHTLCSIKATYIALHSLHTLWSVKVTDTLHCIPYTYSGPSKWPIHFHCIPCTHSGPSKQHTFHCIPYTHSGPSKWPIHFHCIPCTHSGPSKQNTFHCIPCTHSGPSKWPIHFTAFLTHILVHWNGSCGSWFWAHIVQPSYLVLSTDCSAQLLGPEHRLFSPVTWSWAQTVQPSYLVLSTLFSPVTWSWAQTVQPSFYLILSTDCSAQLLPTGLTILTEASDGILTKVFPHLLKGHRGTSCWNSTFPAFLYMRQIDENRCLLDKTSETERGPEHLCRINTQGS